MPVIWGIEVLPRRIPNFGKTAISKFKFIHCGGHVWNKYVMNYVSLKPTLPAETPAGSVPRILKLLCCFSVKTERQYSTQKRTRKPIRFVAWSETNYRCSELFWLSKYLQDNQFFFKLSKISENFRRINIFGNLEIAFQV